MVIGLKTTTKINPVQNANILSQLTFLYMLPIFIKSFKEKLTEDDLFGPLKEHKSSHIGSQLEGIWKEEYRKNKKWALHRALFRQFGLFYMMTGVLRLFGEVMMVVVIPLFIGKLLPFFDVGQTSISKDEAYIYAGCLVLCLLVNYLTGHPALMSIQHFSMKLRVACSSLLYRKILRLSKSSLGQITVGQLVNLLSTDLTKFDQGFVMAHYCWVGPIQVAIGTYMLYREIGMAAFIGVGFLVAFVPLQILLAKKNAALRLRTALRTDERVRLMNEIIGGIQVIKMYCWEKPFAELIKFARKQEMKAIRSHAFLLSLVYSLEPIVSRTALYLSVIGYVLLGNEINAGKIFAITSIYNTLRTMITIYFSISLTSITEVSVSIRRVQKILELDEQNDLAIIENGMRNVEKYKKNGSLNGRINLGFDYSPSRTRPKILLENVSAKWLKDSKEDTVSNLNLSVTSNQLLAIVGPVGSGKSSIINLLLHELPVASGQITIEGTVSFSSQEPWIFSGSVRQNILFGAPYDEDRYQKVVDVCALSADFDLLPHGDRTLVGEKGKSLSGGQKARISLARCIYKEADIYLLDDPLSAVDANIGKHLYERCIKEFLINKISVLVTHQIQYLRNADKIIIMKDGEIQMEGDYNELKKSGLNFAKLLQEFHSEENEENTKKSVLSKQNSEMDFKENDDKEQSPEKESQESGGIKASTYWQYFKAGGGKCSFFIMTLLFISAQAVANGSDYFLTFWVNKEEEHRVEHSNTTTIANMTRNEIIYIYTALTVGNIFINIMKTVYFMLFLIVASRKLHNDIFSKIVKATMTFYNVNPSGRILNRFSKDLGIIDEYLPCVLIEVLKNAFLFIGAVFVSAVVDARLLIPAGVLMLFFYLMRIVYIETSRNVKRIESITKSPILSHMSATVHGLSTIRAFSAQTMLIESFDDLQDKHSAAWYLFISSSRCFALWLDFICVIFIAIAIFSLLYFDEQIYGGEMGLVITQYIGLLGIAQWGMRQLSEMENQMTSVERILEYTKLPSEPERKPIENLPSTWPEKGQIEFRHIKLRYSASEPYILKDLNFTVAPAEKVGIVGRTGAGKSSTIAALFQLYDLEGSIFIDDVDTTAMPLDNVRSKISIIPQEPILFSGPMRKNLDPFDEYSDEVLWHALDQVELKDVISELPDGLDTNVVEGGTNFSVGQRQLVCLARALMRNNKVLVLDEATANVDPHTDALIQLAIRERFKDCSVLTIAHRLHTVMDSDKILVMDAGQVREYDHPYLLLQNDDGILRSLVDATGSSTSRNLENIAKENYEKKKKTE